MFTQRQLEHILVGSRTMSADDLRKYVVAAEAKGVQLEEYLINERLITEDNLYETAASLFQLPFIKIKNQPIRKDVLFLIPEPLAQHYQIAAVDTDGDKILKVITDVLGANVALLNLFSRRPHPGPGVRHKLRVKINGIRR